MTIPIQAPEWPANLLEEGPPEDRSILLRGETAIGSTRFTLTAVRMDPIRFGPDYRADRDIGIYADCRLGPLLDALSDLVEASEAATLTLEAGHYLLWMVPHSGEA